MYCAFLNFYWNRPIVPKLNKIIISNFKCIFKNRIHRENRRSYAMRYLLCVELRGHTPSMKYDMCTVEYCMCRIILIDKLGLRHMYLVEAG